ncbi:MAG: hypothetical protein RL272_873 [Candidatus Parcubacteria bacterium]|jgi:hypothetical protein
MAGILYFDFRNDKVALAAVAKKASRWIELPAGTPTGRAVDAALRRLGFRAKHPSCVTVAAGGAREKRNVSWSTVRAGVAAANALAFAWNVGVSDILIDGDETHEALEAKIRAACAGMKPGEGWASALYSGEPTITKAKPIM